jgi:phosphatidate phosphatase APP1
MLGGCAPRCVVKKDEEVSFYPTYIYRQADGRWAMPVMGRVHEITPDSALAHNLNKMINLAVLLPGAAPNALALKQHLEPFLIQGRSGKEVPVEFESKKMNVGTSDADGYLKGDVVLPVSPPQAPSASWVAYHTPECKDDARTFEGNAVMIGETGLSVVADLDALAESQDTNSDHSQTLPLLEPFKVNRSWVRLYDHWQKKGAVFHYLSTSPWQLFHDRSQALALAGLPRGVLQMKTVPLHSLGDSLEEVVTNLAPLFAAHAAYNQAAVESLMVRFPHRQFILIGDAKNGDAEAYAALARQHPGQVDGIWIRDTAGARPDHYRQVFQDLPADLWNIVTN